MTVSKVLIFSFVMMTGGFLSLPAHAIAAEWDPLSVLRSVAPQGSANITVTVPGRMAVSFADGTGPAIDPDETGLWEFYDLVNDPDRRINLNGSYGGIIDPVYNYTVAGVAEEVMASRGVLTIVEQNAIRTRLTFTWNSKPYGKNNKPDDGLTTGQLDYTVYAPDKIYETMAIFNLTSVPIKLDVWTAQMWAGIRDCNYKCRWNTLPANNPYPWFHEGKGFVEFNADNGRATGQTSPVLHDHALPVAGGSLANSVAFLHRATSPGTGFANPYAFHNNDGTLNGVTAIIKANLLYILAKPDVAWTERHGEFFLGIRSALRIGPAPTLPARGLLSYHAALHLGDNGITGAAVAQTYVDEYRNLVAPTMISGALAANTTHIANGFDYNRGSYRMSGSTVRFTTHNVQHYPVFEISNWAAAVPATILVGGVTKTLNRDYSAVKLDATTLLLQYRSVVGDATRFEIGTSDASSPSSSSASPPSPTPPPTPTSNSGGRTIAVAQADNLQAKLNTAQPGDTFLLQAGAVWKGPITLPNVTGASATRPITIRSAAPDSVLPLPGVRMTPASASYLPKITDDGYPALNFADGAHDWNVFAIEFKRVVPQTPNVPYSLVQVGRYDMSTMSQVVRNIVFDRVYVHGEPGDETIRGFWMNGANVTLKNSWIDEIHNSGKDSQAIYFDDGPGPYLIDNNHIEAAGENVIFCGALLGIPGVQPEHVTFTRNHVTKSLTWMLNHPSFVMPRSGVRYVVKNLFEMKCGAHVLVDGNLFEYNWASHQGGPPIGILNWQNILGTQGSANTIPQAWTHDITFSNNIIRHVAGGFVIRGRDTSTIPESARNVTHHITIRNNLLYDIDLDKWCGVPGKVGCNSGDIFVYAPTGVDTLTIEHNTVFFNPPLSTQAPYAGKAMSGKMYIEDGLPSTNMIFRNNLLHHGSYGVSGPRGAGHGTLDAITNVVFSKNAIVGIGTSLGYTPAMYSHYPDNLWLSSWSDVGFIDSTNENFRLRPRSEIKNAGSDGKDIGADIDAIERALNSSISSGSSTSSPSPPSTTNPPDSSGPPPSSSTPPPTGSPTPTPSRTGWGNLTHTTGLNTFGERVIEVTVPGQLKIRLSAGDRQTHMGLTTGIHGVFDLKNDPQERYNLSHRENGIFSHAYGVFGGNTPNSEYKRGGPIGVVVVLEANAIRVKLLYTGFPVPYGNASYPPGTDVLANETFVIYGPDKIYETHELVNVYPGPLRIADVGLQLTLQNSWLEFSGEADSIGSASSWALRAPSPTTFINQRPDGAGGPVNYILHVNQPGFTTHVITGERILLPQNYLMIVKEDEPSLSYAYRGQLFMGMRSKLEFGSVTIPEGGKMVRHMVTHLGDNGITSRAIANTYFAEYHNAVAPTMSKGTLGTGAHVTNGFDYENGCYSMINGASGLEFVTWQTQHYPVFQIGNWAGPVPATIRVNGLTRSLETDYKAVKVGGSILLLQYLDNVENFTRFEMSN